MVHALGEIGSPDQFRMVCSYNAGFCEEGQGRTATLTKLAAAFLLNIQSKNGKAKPYQVKQVRNVMVKYKLGGDSHG